MTNRKIEYWVIPPDCDAEFVAGMEDVLEVYSRPYKASTPVLVMDEQPVQLLKETRIPIPGTKDHPQRVDYEYERAGMACVFMFAEPLAAWREVKVRKQRKKTDWAQEMEVLMNSRYANCEKIILVCDNLNTHTRGAFYEAFPADKARKLVERLEFHHTPKHGSWLNMAENELSALTRQCLSNRRIESIEILQQEVNAWAKSVNKDERGIDWQFNAKDARRKLKHLYPNI